MRRAGLALALAALGFPALAGSLDTCRVIVSGTAPDRRADGLAACLAQVLVKVSGDPTIDADPNLPAITAQAAALAEDFAYFDRMGDIPHHDEQGSRDRPFDLLAHFAPARVDAALAELHRRPWRTARPVLAVDLHIQDRRGGSFTLTADGDDGERQRTALFAAAARFGLRVTLPPAAPSGTVPLAGTLRWSDPDFGWVAAWHLGDTAWEIRGVSFDAAFRNGVGTAASLLSRAAAPQ